MILEGITEIGINAFRDCRNLKKVSLPKTLGRIHAYAFRDCTTLAEIISPREEWRYEKDKRKFTESDTVVFGFQAFHYCPFAIRKWDNFYMPEDVLYVCFSGRSRLEIPEGVQLIKPFAMADLTADEIHCPDTLERIDRFAFSRTLVRKKILLPDEMISVDSYAFADCVFSSIKLPTGWVPVSLKKYKTNYDTEKAIFIDLKRIPKLKCKYRFGYEIEEEGEYFRKMKVIEDKEVHHRDRSITAIWDNNYFDAGTAILQKIRRGSVLVCVSQEDGRIIDVKVLAMRHIIEFFGVETDSKMPCLYLMYPEKKGRKILPWSDSYTYFESDEIRYVFRSMTGPGWLKPVNCGICSGIRRYGFGPESERMKISGGVPHPVLFYECSENIPNCRSIPGQRIWKQINTECSCLFKDI